LKKILLDTNAYSRFLTGDTNVMNTLAGAETVFMSIFVLGELYAGFKGGNKEHQNRGLLDTFLHKPTVKVLNASQKTADIFGMIKDALKKAGKPLPINDVWIAAHAIETDSLIITYDKHFLEISGIKIWNYTK